MKNLAKLITVSFFGLGAMVIFLTGDSSLRIGATEATATPTASATPTPSPVNASVNAAVTPSPHSSQTPSQLNATVTSPAANVAPTVNGTSPTVNKDFLKLEGNYEGPTPFDHDSHAFVPSYSVDGTKAAGCVVCHHTDQPRSGLKPERSVIMTYDIWKGWKGDEQKIMKCKDCHFAEPPDTPPVVDGKELEIPLFNGKKYYEKITYHENCTICHAAAAKRPGFKPKRMFETSYSGACTKCHGRV